VPIIGRPIIGQCLVNAWLLISHATATEQVQYTHWFSHTVTHLEEQLEMCLSAAMVDSHYNVILERAVYAA